MLDKPAAPKHIVRVVWECLVEAPVHETFQSHLWQDFDSIVREAEVIESEWTTFSTSTVEAARWLVPVMVVTPNQVEVKKASYRVWLIGHSKQV